jgi:endonuclease/exonuclease/phosphatase family metal-dependent hydrolase
MPAEGAKGFPPTWGRYLLRIVRFILTAGVLGVLLLGGIGQIFRDRSVLLGLLFYLPLLPLGLWMVFQDLLFAGRCLPRPRFALALIGLAVAVWSAWPMIGTGSDTDQWPGSTPVSLLHWNVHWGGGKDRDESTWASLMGDIQKHRPDVVVLSEAPPDEWLHLLLKARGWSAVQCENEPGNPYWVKLVVCAAGPLQFEHRGPITNGYLMSVGLTVQDRPLRLLVVDGESDPRLSRVDMLADVMDFCRRAQSRGRPVDVMAGDFNTPSRSIGFDPFRSAGDFRLASRSAVGWRGTFPSFCPLYDIDHIWLRRDFAIQSCRLFSNPASDHRGQIVSFWLPDKR